MAETIAKRTFFEGCYVELFRRNDGTHRIKFTSPEGHEFTLNLDSTLLRCGIPQNTFDEIVYSIDRPADFNGIGSALPHNLTLWRLMINSGSHIKNVIRQLGAALTAEYNDGTNSCST